jgi:hypothetical protein
MEEAKERFTRGLKLYEDANYEAARVEFERAYALAPSWKLLYNVGYCYRQLNDYVAAIHSLNRFLTQGGSEIAQERRAEVEKTLVDLRPRIASIQVTTNVAGATIFVDDVPVGTSPLAEPVLVNPGRRKISASQKGGSTTTQVVTVAGREELKLRLEIEGPRTIVVEKHRTTNLVPYVAWGATAALAIGTAVTGVLSLGAKSDQQDLLDKPPSGNAKDRQAALDDARSKTNTLAGVTDALLATTIVAGGVATYFTIKAISDSKSEKKEVGSSPYVRAGLAGPGVGLSGQF